MEGDESPRGRKRAKWFVMGMVVLSAVTAWQMWVIRKKAEEDQTPQRLVVDPDKLVLGDVWETADFKLEIPIRNADSKSIRVVDFTTSCGCLSIEPKSFHLAPGATQTIQLRLNLTLSLRTSEGTMAVNFVPILAENGLEERGWVLQGRIRRLLRFSEPEPFITATEGEMTAESEKVITITSSSRLTGLDAKAEPALAHVSVESRPDQKDCFSLRIRPNADLPPGPFRFSVRLLPHREGGHFPQVDLSVNGIIRNLVSVSPEVLHLGTHRIGEVAAETVVLQAKGNRGFVVDKVSVATQDLTVKAATEGQYVLTQRITKVGKQEEQIIFLARTEDGKMSRAGVRVSYIGLP